MINPQLSESIDDYSQALQKLSQEPCLLSLEQVLDILNTRDTIQRFIKEDSTITIEQQKKLIELDKFLKTKSTDIITNHDLPQLRKSFFPDESYWWWYLEQLPLKVNHFILNYRKSLIKSTELLDKYSQGSINKIPYQFILDVLLSRDILQQNLTNKSPTTRDMNRVRVLDRKLKQILKTFPKNLNSYQRSQLLREWENWQEIYQPNNKAWWWFPHIPVYWWDRLDGLWNFTALVLFAINLSLFLELSSRFLGSSSGLGLLGAFSLIVNIFLALISGGIFTDFGKSIMKKILKSRGIPEYFQQELKVIIGLIILLFFIVIYQQGLPQIAKYYHNQGAENHTNNQLGNAEKKYKRALSLDPDHPETNYILGLLYEDLQQNEQAEIQYNLAVKGGSSAASNNLARLYILSEDEKKYPIVLSLLQKGIVSLTEKESIDKKENTYYVLYKNLGWVYLKQGHYEKAKKELEKAITIADTSNSEELSKNASAPCLLAQVQEKIGGVASAKEMLKRCINSTQDLNIPEEQEWIEQAQKKLQKLKEKP